MVDDDTAQDDYQKTQAKTRQRTSDTPSMVSEPSPTPDITQEILTTLNKVFATFQGQLQNQTPKPLDGAAKAAVEAVDNIVAALNFRFLPVGPKLTAKAISATEIELTWTDDTYNADGYRLKRCQGTACGNLIEITTLAKNLRSYRDANLSGNTVYRYQLVAFNVKGEGSSDIVELATQ